MPFLEPWVTRVMTIILCIVFISCVIYHFFSFAMFWRDIFFYFNKNLFSLMFLISLFFSSRNARDVQNRQTCRTEGADFNKVRLFVNHQWAWCLTEIFQQKGQISFDLHRTWQCEHNIGIGYDSELIWQWKIDLSCPFTIHKHEF